MKKIKILYCIDSLDGAGGRERVLINKANYFSQKDNYDVSIITTNSIKKNNFFKINSNIKIYELEINNMLNITNNLLKKSIKFIYNKLTYIIKMRKFLLKNRFDIVFILGDDGALLLPFIKDKSKKVRELHFNKEYRNIRASKKNFIYRLKAKIETYLEDKISNKYDLFVVLTNEDKIKWKNSKVEVIPNFLEKYPTKISELKNKKIISVGRLDYQKGFDLLIDVFEKVTRVHPEWKLEIYGEGEEKEKLNEKIKNKNLDGNINLNGVTIEIGKRYIEASIYVMSSRYEGMPMVLVEAQAHGLPIVSFDCPCGPKDIITANKNGFLCNFGNIDDMAEKIIYLIDNIEIRKNFGKKARENSLEYSEEKIMEKWENLLQVLIKE